MKQMNDEYASNQLRKAGFTESAISRLIKLRQGYAANALDQAPLDLARLRFVRWLVRTGRITDQIAEEDAPGTPDQAPLNPPRVPLVQRFVSILITQDSSKK